MLEKAETLPLKGGDREHGEVALGAEFLAEQLHLLFNSYIFLDHVMVEFCPSKNHMLKS